MSDLLSVLLMQELNAELSDDENGTNSVGEIEVDYIMVSGLREGSSLAWEPGEGNLYYKNALSGSTGVRSCKCYYNGCSARLYIRRDGTAFKYSSIKHADFHGSMYLTFKYMYCFNKMKQKAKAATASTSSYDIFSETVLEWQTDPLCDGTSFPKNFNEVQRTLEDCRKKKFGKSPTNGVEIRREFEKVKVFESLGRSRHYERGILFNVMQITDSFENCIFSSSKSISLILDRVSEENRFFLMDATFRITPRGTFQQVLILHFQLGIKTFPIAFILMSRRTTEAYLSALRYIHDNLIPLVGKGIIIDFEKAERLALMKLDSEIDILGCWFHFCQALRRKMTAMTDLFKLVRSNEKAKFIFRQFQCLALLPANMIEKAFIELSKEALKVSTEFGGFIDYFHKEWIKTVKPIHFSVFMRGTRTTAGAEAFNGLMNKRFKTHGSFFHFCESLQKEEVTIAQQLENDINGTVQKDNQNAFYKRRNKLIRKYSLMLRDENMDPMLFLRTMANHKNRILYTESEISNTKIEVEMSLQTELYGGLDTFTYEEVDDLFDLENGIISKDVDDPGQTSNSTTQETSMSQSVLSNRPATRRRGNTDAVVQNDDSYTQNDSAPNLELDTICEDKLRSTKAIMRKFGISRECHVVLNRIPISLLTPPSSSSTTASTNRPVTRNSANTDEVVQNDDSYAQNDSLQNLQMNTIREDRNDSVAQQPKPNIRGTKRRLQAVASTSASSANRPATRRRTNTDAVVQNDESYAQNDSTQNQKLNTICEDRLKLTKTIMREFRISRECRVVLSRIPADLLTPPSTQLNNEKSNKTVHNSKKRQIENENKFETSSRVLRSNPQRFELLKQQRSSHNVENGRNGRDNEHANFSETAQFQTDMLSNTNNNDKQAERSGDVQMSTVHRSKIRRIETEKKSLIPVAQPTKMQTKRRKNWERRKIVTNILTLRPALEVNEMVWAHIRGYANWPGIIEEETANGKYVIHFFGDYTRSVVSKNKIMHLLEGFNHYASAKEPTRLLMKAIREAQIFVLEENRKECPICKMLHLKSQMTSNYCLN